MDKLETIAALSQEFGAAQYVLGGGGNTSCKDEATLWIKPSGIAVADMTPRTFVAVDRAKLAALYSLQPPEAPAAREALVKDLMLAAVRPGSSGRPSVEAPLHDSFDAAFVVHLHPALVNGMTCAGDGEAACGRLFPDALWVPYTDPGYSLSMACRRRMRAYADARGRQPTVVFLQNHGVFVAGDSAGAIRDAYGAIMRALSAAYARAGILAELVIGPGPTDAQMRAAEALLRDALGPDEAAFVRGAGACALAEGPLTPDHVVHSRSYPLIGEPTPDALAAFRNAHGYLPRVIARRSGVFAVGASEKAASLALEFALDGALVRQLAGAFGGVGCMDDAARDFIEHWEVEAYRRAQQER